MHFTYIIPRASARGYKQTTPTGLVILSLTAMSYRTGTPKKQ